MAQPPPGLLPLDRTEGSRPFQVIRVDFAGPIKYVMKRKQEAKSYIVLYACSLTRAVYLELLHSLVTQEFIQSLKRLIARRGRPTKVYSDNAKTFEAAARWLKTAQSDERFNDFLAVSQIYWQFNLSRAPWWGEQFERLIGLVKRALHKTIGNGCLRWNELQEILLDIEVALNCRPLSYLEEDVQMPTLTPNAMLFVGTTFAPKLEAHHYLADADLRKRAKYLLKCKDAVVRAVKMRAGKTFLERAVNQLYPLELSCDRSESRPSVQLNPDARDFRPIRDAVVAARERIQEIVDYQR